VRDTPQVPPRPAWLASTAHFHHRRDPTRQVDLSAAKTIKSDSAAVLSRTDRHAGKLTIMETNQ